MTGEKAVAVVAVGEGVLIVRRVWLGAPLVEMPAVLVPVVAFAVAAEVVAVRAAAAGPQVASASPVAAGLPHVGVKHAVVGTFCRLTGTTVKKKCSTEGKSGALHRECMVDLKLRTHPPQATLWVACGLDGQDQHF